jgi:Tfp pilus assembly protein PilE
MRKAIVLVEIIVMVGIIGIMAILLYTGVARAIESHNRMQSQPVQMIENGTTLYSYYGEEVKYIEKTIGDKQYIIFIGSDPKSIDIEVFEVKE